MESGPTADQLVGILRDTVVALVRRDGPDLSQRQIGEFLTVYVRENAHLVSGGRHGSRIMLAILVARAILCWLSKRYFRLTDEVFRPFRSITHYARRVLSDESTRTNILPLFRPFVRILAVNRCGHPSYRISSWQSATGSIGISYQNFPI